MSRDIPFFEMFTELQLSGALRLKLAGAVLRGASIDQTALTMALELLVELPLAEADLAEIREAIQAVYGLRAVEIAVKSRERRPDAPPSASGGPAPAPSGGGSRAGGDRKGGKVLMGSALKARPGPMRDLNLKMGTATVEG